jgi:Bacterial SH3 domain
MRSYITVILVLVATGCSQPRVQSTAPIENTTVQSTRSTSATESTTDSATKFETKASQNKDTQVEPLNIKLGTPLIDSKNQQATLTSGKRNSRINIRDAASTKANAKNYGFAGDSVTILDKSKGDNGSTWYKIKSVKSGAEGWVSGNFVKLNKNDEVFNSTPIINSPSIPPSIKN